MAESGGSERQESRNDLAEDRTVLANERTFAGWMRTGFAAVGIGLGFNVLFKMLQPPWVPKAIATAFLLTGIYIFIVAEQRACRVMKRFDERKVAEMRPMNLRVVTLVTVAATLALIAGIWMLT
ncbi:MAG TPA: DUF202 domain-containing protein [Allosphingosinicella sp.]|jgi:putative membrane protein